MRHGIVACAFVLAAGLLLSGDLKAGSLEPPGPPGPTMKTIQQAEPRVAIGSTPVVIATSGSYYLTSDVFGGAGQSGITINASFVTLDLNGFSLIGGPGAIDGIRATFPGIKHLVIRNGVIRNWGGHGIIALAPDVHAEDLRIDANGGHGLVVGQRSIVRNTTATGNAFHGIFADAGSTVIGCTAGSNSNSGIVLGLNAAVSSSTAMFNVTAGIVLNTGAVATDCAAQSNSTGFSLGAGSRVLHSVARANGVGINAIGDGGSIEECTVEANTDDGIRVSNRGLVRGNVARGNTNDGIEATSNENRIEENESTANGVGIAVFGTSNLVVKNSASANTNTEYGIFGGGNKIGTISTDPTTANPWANFDL